jgi:hypothetical protein
MELPELRSDFALVWNVAVWPQRKAQQKTALAASIMAFAAKEFLSHANTLVRRAKFISRMANGGDF